MNIYGILGSVALLILWAWLPFAAGAWPAYKARRQQRRSEREDRAWMATEQRMRERMIREITRGDDQQNS